MPDRPRHLLFVCSKNRLRSPTAEAVFNEEPGFEAIGAGLDPGSPTPLSGDLVEWADVILTMEAGQRAKVVQQYQKQLRNKKLASLDIPDVYAFMQPELIDLLRRRVPRYLG